MKNNEIKFYDADAELSLLSGAIRSRDFFDEITNLTEDDFYLDSSRALYKIIFDCYQEHGTCDFILIKNKLDKTSDKLDIDFVINVAKSHTSYNPKAVAKIIKNFSNKRQVHSILSNSLQDVQYNTLFNTDDIITETTSKLYEVGDVKDKNITYFRDFIKNGIDDFLSLNFIPTGFSDIDNKIAGFFGGEISIIAARPSLGKTTLALQIAYQIAKMKSEEEVLFFSLEMKSQQLGIKLLSKVNKISSQKIRVNKLSESDRDKMFSSFRDLSQPNLAFVNHIYSLASIIKNIHSFLRKKKVAAIFIDYLQLIEVNSREPQHIKVGEISRELKKTAVEYDIPIIALAQLNRTAEDERPKLSSLKDSGCLEQDGDCVIFIDKHRKDGKTEMSSEGGPVDIIFAKNRMGETGIVKMYFDKQYSEFTGITKNDYDRVHDPIIWLGD
jgi:replicative DNA helicase